MKRTKTAEERHIYPFKKNQVRVRQPYLKMNYKEDSMLDEPSFVPVLMNDTYRMKDILVKLYHVVSVVE